MAIYGASLKDLTSDLSPNYFLGVPMHVGKSGKIFETKSQC